MNKTWWHDRVVYQIYPRSFKDSNGDGIGDLRGIIEKLDYLQKLGVGIVWLSPVYQSPNDDNGYDVSDYRAIMDEFGTMADWEAMLAEMHKRDIKLVMDLVVNHTSDEHAWFVESRKSKDNPYRDYYIWRPAKEGKEPNNWGSFFSGSAWQYDPATDEYFLHLFSKKQPDLNWENPNVRTEVFDMMRWWLDKGVDGFRMDVINMISKVPGLPDSQTANGERYQIAIEHFIHGPRMLEFFQEMKEQALAGYNTFTVGEMGALTTDQAAIITHHESGQLNTLFQFEHMDLDVDPGGTSKWDIHPWRLTDLKRVMTRWQKGLEGRGWNSSYLNNHDQPRAVSRFGDDTRYHYESATLLATFIHTLHGTPYVYQGEEIGMTNVQFDTIDDYRDVETLNVYKAMVEEKGWTTEKAMASIHAKSRDNARTPMQWDDSPNAGFTTGTPWIKVNPAYTHINVAAALADPHSIFYYYQRLIQLRKELPVLVYGTYDLLLEEDEQIYAFTRTYEGERLLVILNFTADTPMFRLPSEVTFGEKSLVISNYAVAEEEDIGEITLRPYEARAYKLT